MGLREGVARAILTNPCRLHLRALPGTLGSMRERRTMPGRHVNDQQVRPYMRLRITRPQMTAAAMAGISVASGRRIERDPPPPSSRGDARDYRTRTDPLAGIWDEEIVPLLEGAPRLRPACRAGFPPPFSRPCIVDASPNQDVGSISTRHLLTSSAWRIRRAGPRWPNLRVERPAS